MLRIEIIFPFCQMFFTKITRNTFLIHRVERYNIKGKEIVSGTCKFYINDLAFKNYLYSGFGKAYSSMEIESFVVAFHLFKIIVPILFRGVTLYLNDPRLPE